jgi:signal transduction histidine kinase
MTREAPTAWDRWYAILDNPSPLVKQAPTVIVLGLAVLLTLTVPDLSFHPLVTALAGVATVAVATALAVVLTVQKVYSGWVVLLIPMADMLGLGLFRAGTGGAGSLFAGLILLPIVWIAAAPGLRYVLIVTGLTAVALVIPFLSEPPTNSSEWLRIIITPVVFSIVAAIVNELSRVARVRATDAEALATQRAEALEDNLRVVAQLQASELRYKDLLEMFRSVWNATTAQAVVGTDRDGLVVLWNPGATALFGSEDIDTEYAVRIDRYLPASALDELDEGAPATTPGDSLSPGLRALLDSAELGAPAVRELEMRRINGTTVPVRLTVTTRRDGAGDPIGYLFVAIDETRAIEVARMKDEFVGMISHELRTPLSSILGYIELLRDDPQHPLTEEQLQFLGVAERNARRLLKLVGDLLFTAQVESGQFPLDLRGVDLVALVSAALETAAPIADAAGIELASELPDEPVMLRLDPVRIGQAIDNLVSNAVKFTPRGGTVTVGIGLPKDEAVVTVRDTGMGIAPDELDRLFTRFFRASSATRNAVPGVGLGLNITKAIVIAHGGTMDVSSEEGVGTEFRMVLPRR